MMKNVFYGVKFVNLKIVYLKMPLGLRKKIE